MTRLKERINNELSAFIADLRTKDADTIINSAYEVVIKQDITQFISNLDVIRDLAPIMPEFESLLKADGDLLHRLYNRWCDKDNYTEYSDIRFLLTDMAFLLHSEKRGE